MRILSLNHRPNGVTFYRGQNVFQELCRQTGWTFDAVDPKNFDLDKLPGYDIYFDLRPTRTENINMLYLAWKAGLKIWIDLDDLLWQIPAANSASINWKPEADENLKKALANADIVTTTTDALAEAISRETQAPVAVVPNAWNDRLFELPKAWNGETKKEFTTFFWRGSNTHDGDLYAHRQAFQPSDKTLFRFMGALPWYFLKAYGGPLETIHWDSFNGNIYSYFDQIRRIAPDCFVFPLEDNDFNRCKSNIAWIEATISGSAIIAPSYMLEFNKTPALTYADTETLAFMLNADLSRKMQHSYLDSRIYLYEELRLSYINTIRETIAKQITCK